MGGASDITDRLLHSMECNERSFLSQGTMPNIEFETVGETTTHQVHIKKRRIDSFLLANVCDGVLTAIALQLPGFSEKGFVAGEMLSQAMVVELVIFKIAITAFMIGIYALAVQDKGRWSFPVETALRIGTGIVWTIVAWNELNIVFALDQWIQKSF